ncbi:aminopeptidase N isoform X2 [Drosophila mauritiana]|uniref:Aminopeptidase N isoform X2 n=1 Tax=Drosophila mauritiana TaxID=7226 RepID=A0A6P8JRX7_DROMA|nr:aminopeptidase N isoform X2 [Drosophila mauritiana]
MLRLCLQMAGGTRTLFILTILLTAPGFKAFVNDFSSLHVISEVRLPNEVLPLSYDVLIEPHMDNQNFEGSIKMHLRWIADSKKVYFHAHDSLLIDVSQIILTTLNMGDGTLGNNVIILRGIRLPRKPVFVLYLKDKIKKGSECLLDIYFQGNISETEEGLFRSSYTNSSHDGGEIYLATNLNPNNARRLFPCFDEPGIKVPFNVSIARPKGYITLFNTPLHNSINHPKLRGYSLDFFHPTAPMSSHAFGFVILKMHTWNEHKIQKSSDIPAIHIWSNNLSSTIILDIQNKLNVAHTTIQKFFSIPLPITKLDVIAIPSLATVPFISASGILIARESEILKKDAFEISRELIYQWIGIWITPEWWTDANVNKALISFIASEIVFEINGGKEFNGKYPMTILYSLYYELSKRYPNSHITGIKHEFASIKVQLIIRMLCLTVGKYTFRLAIQSFISDYKFKTYKSSDFWNAITTQAIADNSLDSDLSILSISESWLKHSRLPLVTIIRDYDSETAIVQQKVYLRERLHDVPDQDSMLWWIPIALTRQDSLNFVNPSSFIWMNKTRQMLISNLPSKNMFIIVNEEEIGPFPVNYDDNNWNMLSKYLRTEEKRESIPVYTRAKLLHDAWNLAYAGELNFSTALNVTLFLKYERNHIVWSPVFTFLDQVGKRLEKSSINKKFELYIIELLAPLYEYLGTAHFNEDINTTELRKFTTSFLCKAGYFPCFKEARRAFNIWINSSFPNSETPVPNEFICSIFKWGSMEEWMFGLDRIREFPKSRIQSDRTHLLKMLAGCPAQQDKIIILLEMAILKNISIFSDNDKMLIISMVTSRSIGYTTLLDFLSNNWDYIHQEFNNNTNIWSKLISSATGMFSTQQGYDSVKNFYDKHHGHFGRAQHIIEKSLRNIKEEIQWSNQNIPVIEEWIDHYLSDAPKHAYVN